MKTLVQTILITFFIFFLYDVLSAQEESNALDTIIFTIVTDDFPNESSWTMSNGNSYEVYSSSEGLDLQANTTYSDTLISDPVKCLRLKIEDSGGDGLGITGSFELWKNGVLVQSNVFVGSEFNKVFFCSEGLVCEEAIPLNDGSELLKNELNSWFVVRPINDTYYMMRSTSSCDTRMWIYDACGKDHPTHQTGAILFSDDLNGKAAGFNQIRLDGGKEYFVRVENDPDCNETTFFYLVDLKLKEGCMDPTSCNFDPLANLDNNSCTYGDCHPDLAINKEELLASIHLDSIDNENECLIAEGCLQGYGKRDIIRFTTQIDNDGDADYIVGEPQDNSPLFSEQNCHQHWHYLGYAEYILFDGSGVPRPGGFKNGFCALDFRCESDKAYKYDCNYMGISAGCYDTYEHDLLCQWVDITDVEDGIYTLVVRVNYTRAPDLFGRTETDHENNWAQVCINIDRSSGKLRMNILDTCPDYTDCQGFKFGNTQVDCNGICGGLAHFGDINQDNRVDQLDLAEYEQFLQDGSLSITPCLDLSGDESFSIYDISLLNACLINNPYDEQNPLHTHCDFPKSITNSADTVSFRINDYVKEEGYLILEYKSNTPFVAFDLLFNRLRIDSLVEFEAREMIPLVHNNRMAGMIKNADFVYEKSVEFQPFIKAYIQEKDQIEACITSIVDVINQNQEQMITLFDPSCISLITTATDDSSLSASIEIFPNPASDIIYFENPDLLEIRNWSIYDAQGNLVLRDSDRSKTHFKVEIKDVTSGYYFVKINSDQGQLIRSFVKL